MKHKFLLFGLLAVLLVLTIAFVPSLTDFCVGQFNNANNKVTIASGALTTNLSGRGLTIPNATASRPLVADGAGNVTNASGTADATTFLRGDNTLAVPNYPTSANTTATDLSDLAIELFSQYSVGVPVLTNGFGWYGGGRLVGGQIVSRTISGYAPRTETRLAITNGVYARTFAWGNQWKRLRVGIIWSVNAVASFGVTNLYFGINSGTNNTPFDASTSAYIGTANLNGTATWAFNAGTDYPYFLLSSFQNLCTRRATTSTNVVGGSISFASSATHTNRLPVFLEIDRNGYGAGTTYTVQMIYPINTQHGRESDWNYQGALAFMIQYVSGNASWINLTSTSQTTTVFDENGGPLDTLVFAWDNPNTAIEISCLIVQRLY